MHYLQIAWIVASAFLAWLSFRFLVVALKTRTNWVTDTLVSLVGALACYTYFNGGVA